MTLDQRRKQRQAAVDDGGAIGGLTECPETTGLHKGRLCEFFGGDGGALVIDLAQDFYRFRCLDERICFISIPEQGSGVDAVRRADPVLA